MVNIFYNSDELKTLGLNRYGDILIRRMSLVNKNLKPWAMCKGIPARRYTA